MLNGSTYVTFGRQAVAFGAPANRASLTSPGG